MPAVKPVPSGIALTIVAAFACPAGATLTGDFTQSVSPTSGYVLNQLKVQSDTDWISGQILVELSAGQLLYFTPGATPGSTSSLYTSPGSSTRPYGGTLADPINSAVPGFGALPDVASLLDNPPPLVSGYYPAVASLTKFDMTWYGDPAQTDDTATGGDFLNLLNLTANDEATGTWSVRLSNMNEADDLLISGVVYRGNLLDSLPRPGDINLDGTTNLTDFVRWRTNFLTPVGSPVLASGDLNNDGVVNLTDFVIWRTDFLTPAPLPAVEEFAAISAVPEPGSLAALILGCGVVLARRRR